MNEIKINLLIKFLLLLLLIFNITPKQANALTEELPECIVITHCVRQNLKVNDVAEAFNSSIHIISRMPRTKIVERTSSFIHAETKTKWIRYTDDFLIKAIPKKGIIQVRSESRIGIGDNGVNKQRVNNFTFQLMAESIKNN